MPVEKNDIVSVLWNISLFVLLKYTEKNIWCFVTILSSHIFSLWTDSLDTVIQGGAFHAPSNYLTCFRVCGSECFFQS